MIREAKAHYNSVTDAWRIILGENFHLGYFKPEIRTLFEAANTLINELAGLAHINRNTKILDVGCGIGGPAIYLHKKFGCFITGITISEKGVELAKRESEKRGYSQKVKFRLSDALDNGFNEKSFDLAWVMESSHLMRDKNKLFSESYRVLKNNGVILLCDMVLKKEISVLDIVKYQKQIEIMERVFGTAQTQTLQYYKKGLEKTGFSNIVTLDVSENIFPSMEYWRTSVIQNREEVLKSFSPEKIEEFISACDILEDFYRRGILGYGFVKAEKLKDKDKA